MRDELGPQGFSDIERNDQVRSLINRAVRLFNRSEIDEATIDEKGVVFCNDAEIAAELQQEYLRLEGEMRQAGLDIQLTLGRIDDGDVVYDPMHEDPFGTSDLKPDAMPPDGNHLPDGWGDSGWHE